MLLSSVSLFSSIPFMNIDSLKSVTDQQIHNIPELWRTQKLNVKQPTTVQRQIIGMHTMVVSSLFKGTSLLLLQMQLTALQPTHSTILFVQQ